MSKKVCHILGWSLSGIRLLLHDCALLASDTSASTSDGILGTLPGTLFSIDVSSTPKRDCPKIKPMFVNPWQHAHTLAYDLVIPYLYPCHAVATDRWKYNRLMLEVQETWTREGRPDRMSAESTINACTISSTPGNITFCSDAFSNATLSCALSVVRATLRLRYQWY